MSRWQAGSGFLEPGLQRCHERLGLFLSHDLALVGALAAYLGFDLVEFGNPPMLRYGTEFKPA